jgi:uncharacterized protein (TIGR02996 family)
MTQDEAIMQTIRENPGDDLPRLAYADWLEERGRPGDAERAEFIRVQIELARLGPDGGPRSLALVQREGELLQAHRPSWVKAMPHWSRQQTTAFRRGFVAHVDVLVQHFLRGAATLRRRTPLESVHLRFRGAPEYLRAVFASPHLGGLRRLDLSFNEALDADGVAALACSPHLASLTDLDLMGNVLGDEGVRALADSPHLARLTSLVLSRNDIGLGVRSLAASPQLGRLEVLDLGNNRITSEDALTLARSPYLPRLIWLSLDGNPIGAEGRALLEQRFGKSVYL